MIIFCKKMFGEKKFWSKKELLVKKNFQYNSFQLKKKIGVKNFVENFFRWKKNLVEKIWSKKIFSPKKMLVKKNVGQKIFSLKNFCSKSFFVKKKWVGLTLGRGFMSPPPPQKGVGLKLCGIVVSCLTMKFLFQ